MKKKKSPAQPRALLNNSAEFIEMIAGSRERIRAEDAQTEALERQKLIDAENDRILREIAEREDKEYKRRMKEEEAAALAARNRAIRATRRIMGELGQVMEAVEQIEKVISDVNPFFVGEGVPYIEKATSSLTFEELLDFVSRQPEGKFLFATKYAVMRLVAVNFRSLHISYPHIWVDFAYITYNESFGPAIGTAGIFSQKHNMVSYSRQWFSTTDERRNWFLHQYMPTLVETIPAQNEPVLNQFDGRYMVQEPRVFNSEKYWDDKDRDLGWGGY